MRTDRLFDPHEPARHELTPAQRRRAVSVVAAHARDADDLATLLAMLNLDATDSRPPAPAEPGSPDTGPEPALPPKYLAELAALATRRRTRKAAHRRTEVLGPPARSDVDRSWR